MIYKELTAHDFAHELSSNKDNGFTYEGAKILFEYLNESEIDIEFDAVAIRSDYSEYSLEELVDNYSYNIDEEDYEDEDEKTELVLEYIRDNSVLLEGANDTYILLDF